MIAAGLCVMGGCFAQEADSAAVDTYWAAEKVEIPAISSSILVLYKYDSTPAGVEFENCRFYTKQVAKFGTAGFFTVTQRNHAVISAYYHTDKNLTLEYYSKTGVGFATRLMESPYPLEIEFENNAWGGDYRNLGLANTETGAIYWDSAQPGGILRLLDIRPGAKDFYVSQGRWGHKWYLLPMKSPCDTTAVYDVEAKTLVEL